MIFKWPLFLRPRRAAAVLRAIYIAPGAGTAMQSVNTVEAMANTGLRGDRYAVAKGYWQAIEACQVTLITEQDLRRAGRGRPAELAKRLNSGSHRRNLVVGGIRTRQLEGKIFRIGGAVFRYIKPRPPCGYLEKVEGAGLCKALGRHSGVCVQVVTGGTIAVGDTLEILDIGAAPS
jgi:MOSC domain-containing protein YiiM